MARRPKLIPHEGLVEGGASDLGLSGSSEHIHSRAQKVRTSDIEI